MTEGHCTIMFVAALKDSDIYSPTDILAVISDGEITYDCTGIAQALTLHPAQILQAMLQQKRALIFRWHPRTRGEKKMHSKKLTPYLDYSAFSTAD